MFDEKTDDNIYSAKSSLVQFLPSFITYKDAILIQPTLSKQPDEK